jgi:hypothetical protein
MGKKIALNVVYNLGIFLCLLVGYSGFEHKRYEYVLGTVFIAAILIILKVRLIKEIRSAQKTPE